VVDHVQIRLNTRWNLSQLRPVKVHSLLGGFTRQRLAKQIDLAGKRIDLDELAGLLDFAADASFKLNTAVDEVFDQRLLAGRVTRNSQLPQLLVTLPGFSSGFWLAGATLLKTT
jgi:hypothetical protein